MANRTAIALRPLLRVVAAAAVWQLASAQPPPPAQAPRRSDGEILRGAGALRDPAARRRVVAELGRADRVRRAETDARARARGLPLRGSLPGGGGWELMRFEGEQPVYFTTLNANAAVAACADVLLAAPYSLDGGGGTVGVWDEGSARLTHQEFGGRVAALDNAAVSLHATHVVGTLGAAGCVAAAKGMAPAVRVDSYDWRNDLSEMAARGAACPCEPGAIQISNHSYGEFAGWEYSGAPAFTWHGAGTDAAALEDDFGRYGASAAAADALACALPYYLTFWAAGNDRGYITGFKLTNGVEVALWPGGTVVSYDAARHPPSDDTYRGGYDTMSGCALAKNVVAVGSVTDMVTGGLRDLSKVKLNSWTSWGPADDGRIKPDVVANGYDLYSCKSYSDAAYGGMNGTSQASPSAAGAAQLLIHLFGTLFPGHTLRASTLKALLIHTADDVGNAGPDYCSGWGLINVRAAADLLLAYRAHPGTRRVAEDRVATNRTSVSFAFAWDGASPIRATLCWTDPAGAASAAGDARAPALVNDLHLAITAPDGTAHLPWVMPFVGDWSAGAYALPAVTGTNSTDTVEQVLIAAPASAGVYTARVTFSGALANGSQAFSLLLSGAAESCSAPAPLLTAATPASGTGTVCLTLAGDRFQLGARVRLTRAAQPAVPGANVEVCGDTLLARIDTAGAAGGAWDLALTNPDGQSAVLTNAFAVHAGAAPAKGTVVSLR